jgi:signal transduction histidine kinase/HAMP domain-containing protein
MKLQTKVLLLLLPLTMAASALVLILSKGAISNVLVLETAKRVFLATDEISPKVNTGMRTREEKALLPLLNAAHVQLRASYAMALAPDGAVLAHTNVVEKGKIYTDPVTLQALSNEKPEYKVIDVKGHKILDVVAPIWSNDGDFLFSHEKGGKTLLGILRIGLSIEDTMDTRDRILRRIALILSCTSGVLLLVILLFLHKILFPIRLLSVSTRKIGEGRYDVSVPVTTSDEIGELADAFNKMADTLDKTTVSRNKLSGEVAERKKAEENLLQLLSLHRATLESTADGILVIDTDRTVITKNLKFLQMWLIPDDIAASKDYKKLLAYVLNQLTAPEEFAATVEWLYAHPEEESFGILTFKDGRIFERFSLPQKIENRIVGRVWSFRDITKHRKLEGMLLQSEKMSAVGQLAAGVAHEINNPLGIILGFAQSAVKKIKDDDPLALPLKTIEREAVRCKNLVQNLLVFSRTSKNDSFDKLNLNDAVESALSLILTQTNTRNVELVKKLGACIPDINANRTQLQQITLNLANNAIDAMPNGGTLTIGTSLSDKRPGHVEIHVRDTGTGIPGELQKRVFEPFFTTKEVGKGTGLGLSLVYEMVQKHGGAIELESEEGKGAKFTVFLPVQPAPAQEAA